MNPTTTEAILKLHPTAKFATSGDKVVHWGESYKQPTESEIAAAKETLKTEYTNNKYQRDRAVSYPSLKEQLDLQYWDQVNGTTKWKEAIAKIKADNPKS